MHLAMDGGLGGLCLTLMGRLYICHIVAFFAAAPFCRRHEAAPMMLSDQLVM